MTLKLLRKPGDGVKNYSYSNRGMTLEEFVKYANERYRSAGKAVVTKIPTEFIPIRNNKGKVVSCKVEKKSSVDFIGRYRNVPIAIECKHTSKDRISFSEVKEHQARFLDEFVGEYGAGFGAVLVSFKFERFFLVPWEFWAEARDLWNMTKGDKETVVSYGMKWETTGKASVSADELLPDWEVKLNNKYGLAYLSKIDTYYRFVSED